MKIKEAIAHTRQQLQTLYDEGEAKALTTILLEHLTGYNRLDQWTNGEKDLTGEQQVQLREALNRLQTNEPIQYILNEAPFYGLNLYVDNSVLIPRPETEELVHWIVTDIRKEGFPVFDREPTEADATTSLKIMDIGTGSGCIALALKNEMPKAEVWGCDVSDAALTVARRNGAALNIRVDFVGMDILDAAQQAQLPPVNIIVSNPPYIPIKDKESMHHNVVKFEPHTALFVPDTDPLLFYKAIVAFAAIRLHEKGRLYVEIHEEAATDVMSLLHEAGYQQVELQQDMQGKDRMIKAVRP